MIRDTTGGRGERWSAIAAAGGLFVVPDGADRRGAADEIRRRGINAVQVASGDIAWLVPLELSHLVVTVPVRDPMPLADMVSLESLALDGWFGDVALDGLRSLSAFACSEVEGDQLETALRGLDGQLRSLAVGRLRGVDLAIAGRHPDLVELAINDSRSLATAAGLDSCRGLRRLTLARCSALTDVGALTACERLTGVALEACNRLVETSPLAAVQSLEAVHWEGKSQLDLRSFTGHPALRCVLLTDGKRSLDELRSLHGNPAMRLITSRRDVHVRLGDERWEIGDVYTLSDDLKIRYESEMDAYRQAVFGPLANS